MAVGYPHDIQKSMEREERHENPKRKEKKNGINENDEIVRSRERNGIHSLFIIRKLGWYRFVFSQGAKEGVESVKAMVRYAHLVIGRVGRWVGRKKGH